MNEYQNKLKNKMDEYAHFVYRLSENFPKSELYGITSQIRRAALSVVLNYVEGYARRRLLVRLNFLEISYGSLRESDYLFDFCKDENLLKKDDYNKGKGLTNEIGAMLWKEISFLRKKSG